MGAAKLSLSPLKGHDEDTAKEYHAGSTATAYPTARLKCGGDKCATGAKTTIRLPKEESRKGTRNIHSLHACGKVQELIHELKCYR